MRRRIQAWSICLGLAILGVISAPGTSAAQERVTLPDDPCALLTPADVARIAGIDVTGVAREATRRESQAQVPDDRGSVCRYDAPSVGSVSVILPQPRGPLAPVTGTPPACTADTGGVHPPDLDPRIRVDTQGGVAIVCVARDAEIVINVEYAKVDRAATVARRVAEEVFEQVFR